MKFKLEIHMDNAAFGDDDLSRAEELAAMLKRIAGRIICGDVGAEMRLRDTNGNTVGIAYFEE